MKFPIVTTSISALLVGLFLVFGAMPETLIWQSDSTVSWQIVSTHFVHISAEHLSWNLIAFVILASIIEQVSTKRLLLSLSIGCVFVNLYLLLLFELPAYAGLSGALNTLLVVALYQLALNPQYRAAALLSFGLSIGKIIVESATGDALLSSLIWQSVPAAHLAGLIGGITYSLILYKQAALNKNFLRFTYS